jgi:hypothetical protein
MATIVCATIALETVVAQYFSQVGRISYGPISLAGEKKDARNSPTTSCGYYCIKQDALLREFAQLLAIIVFPLVSELEV